MTENDTRTNKEVIREFLTENPMATQAEIAVATGRKIHSPDLAKVRKEMGISFQRRGRRQQQRKASTNGQVPVVTPSVQLDGITLYSNVIELVKLHGLNRVKAACDSIAANS